MAEKAKVPAIRFKGFTEDWEQRKFSSAVGRVSNVSTRDNLPRVEYEDIISDQGCLNKEVAKKESGKAGIEFSNGDVLFGKLRPYLKNWLLANFSGIAVGDFWVLRSAEVDSRYLYYLIQTAHFQMTANQSTGTKMPRADWNLVSKTLFFFPIDKDEQAKIGATFRGIDNLITLHQRKLLKLKNVKKAMLEKMFPKNGSGIPEIRFAGFTDAWEQRKLGELASFSKGYGYTKSDLVESGTPIILYGRLYTKYETVISEVDTYAHAKKNSIYSQGCEVVVPASGETAEDISRASVVEVAGVLLGGDLNIVSPSDAIDSVFLALSISSGNQKKEMAKRAQGKSVVHLHNADLQEVMLSYPEKGEQREIGAFFCRLDNLVTLHQRKLEKLQNVKKSMLEKMFV